MKNVATLEDIKQAIDFIKEECKDKIIYEDDISIIKGGYGHVESIQLKPAGLELVADFYKASEELMKNNKKKGVITTLWGIPIVVTDDIKDSSKAILYTPKTDNRLEIQKKLIRLHNTR